MLVAVGDAVARQTHFQIVVPLLATLMVLAWNLRRQPASLVPAELPDKAALPVLAAQHI
jgi:hypothetical protein